MTIKQNNIKFRDDTYSTSNVVKLWNNSEGRTWMLFDFRDLWKKKFLISWKKIAHFLSLSTEYLKTRRINTTTRRETKEDFDKKKHDFASSCD